MNKLFENKNTALKVCGLTLREDVEKLIELGVHGIGVNFWPPSKRYISPEKAADFLKMAKGKIVRVGVFVNSDPELPRKLFSEDLIDIVQFHGDESVEYCQAFATDNIPFIKAIGVKNADSLKNITDYGASAILLDTPAPGVYGGTGEKFDWTHAKSFIENNPQIPVLLAGGITPENSSEATTSVRPAALDVASGSESAPGIKDFKKIALLMNA